VSFVDIAGVTETLQCLLWTTAGQVLSRQNIEDVIKFAQREKLLILADEVRTFIVD